jgi:hypothetical protein
MKTIKDFKEMIERGENFSFIKQGDGEIFCMAGFVGGNCDGHPYSPELGEALINAYTFFNGVDNTYITKWDGLNSPVPSKGNVDGDTFLHNDVSDDKYAFFKSLKESKRKKVFVGPGRLRGVINFLNIDEFVEIPLINSWSYKFEVEAEDNAIYIFSAGMPSKVWIAKLMLNNPNITCLDIGSGFDPVFIGATRTRQYDIVFLQKYYKSLLEIPNKIFTIWLSDKEELPPVVKLCKESHENVYGYENRFITLENCYRNKYIQDAIDAKQWGKACDYLRCYYLIKEGGVYMDADVYVFAGKNFDHLLDWEIFVEREENGFINTAVMGAKRGNQLLVDHLKEVEEKFVGNDGKFFESSLEIITPRFNNIMTVEPKTFYPYNHQTNTIIIGDNTIAMHFFMKTWV